MKQKTAMTPDGDHHASGPSFEDDPDPALPAFPKPDKTLPANSRRLEEEPQPVRISAAGVTLEGNLGVPKGAAGIVRFAHGSGSGRRSARNRDVAHIVHQGGVGTGLIASRPSGYAVSDVETPH